ncbi:MAG: ACT domain-containing protein [Actinobacteria bacterium]|nr:ACT domain-containing protein [Actinomycetota bacterium]
MPKSQIGQARSLAEDAAIDIGARRVDVDTNIAKLSIVGAGMKSESGVAATMFRVLSAHGINIEMISTSLIRISCVVRGDDVEEAVRSLHAEFAGDTASGGEQS